uniref:Uncharacterized protein n=1 Tax=Arundo donax TaxID=35708 RepID=A0A0A9BCP6_ARUDO
MVDSTLGDNGCSNSFVICFCYYPSSPGNF